METKEFTSSYYFEDMSACPCRSAFDNVRYPWESLERKERILKYERDLRGNIHPSVIMSGNIKIGKNTVISPYSVIQGPVVIGEGCEIRSGALIRPRTVIGDKVVVGHNSEVKNSIIFNEVKIASNVFVGDSVLGRGARLGSGTILGNRRFDQGMVTVKIGEKRVTTELEKFGCIIGDYSRLGANCTVSPGTLIGKHAWIMSSVVNGFIPSDSMVKIKTEMQIVPKERIYLSRTDSKGNV